MESEKSEKSKKFVNDLLKKMEQEKSVNPEKAKKIANDLLNIKEFLVGEYNCNDKLNHEFIHNILSTLSLEYLAIMFADEINKNTWQPYFSKILITLGSKVAKQSDQKAETRFYKDIEACLETGEFKEQYNPKEYAPATRATTKIDDTEYSKKLKRAQTYSSSSDAGIIKEIQEYINTLYNDPRLEVPYGLFNKVITKYKQMEPGNKLFIYPITDYYVRLSYGKNVCLRNINTRFKTDYDSQIRTEFLNTLTTDERKEYDELTAGQTNECTTERTKPIDPRKLAMPLKKSR
jgi:hypothetical protein